MTQVSLFWVFMKSAPMQLLSQQPHRFHTRIWVRPALGGWVSRSEFNTSFNFLFTCIVSMYLKLLFYGKYCISFAKYHAC